MQFNGRGFYNTLLFSASKSCEKWQIENYQALSTHELFSRLHTLAIALDEQTFIPYLNQADSPEDLTDILCPDDEGTVTYEKTYLIIFELWRRLCPSKETLSIFCDKVDQLLFAYNEGGDVAEKVVTVLTELQTIFEKLSLSPSESEPASSITSYLAHNLDSFLYEFLSELLERGEKTVVFDLLIGFYPYLENKRPFDLLKATINLMEDPEETGAVFMNVIEHLLEEKQTPLILDAIYFALEADAPYFAKKITKELLAQTPLDEKKLILSYLEPIKQELGL